MAPVDVGLLSLPGYDLGADFRRCYVCIVYSIEIPILWWKYMVLRLEYSPKHSR